MLKLSWNNNIKFIVCCRKSYILNLVRIIIIKNMGSKSILNSWKIVKILVKIIIKIIIKYIMLILIPILILMRIIMIKVSSNHEIFT